MKVPLILRPGVSPIRYFACGCVSAREFDLFLECAPEGGQNGRGNLTPLLGFRRMEAMTRHRSHSVAFKRQVAEEFIAGETLHALSKRHDISRQLIRIWVGKFEAGALDWDVQAV